MAAHIENFPGHTSISGPELIKKMRAQAEHFGSRFLADEVREVSLENSPFVVKTTQASLHAQTLIIATGARSKSLDIESEERLLGRGVSICATCDGFFFRDKEIVVVGGGDAAISEAIFLSHYGRRVRIIHRRDKLRANHFLQQQAFKNKKLEFVWDSVVEEILGEEVVSGVRLRNVKTGNLTTISADGVFLSVGHKPNTELFQGKLSLDKQGYITTNGATATSVPGVFTAGDVKDATYRQAITAAASGCMAAIDVIRFLDIG